MKLHKNSIAIRLSLEQVYMHRGIFDSRYNRRVDHINVTQPTEAEWAEYRKAKEAHEYLLNSPYFDDGGPDERSQVSPPEPSRECIYAEAIEEWLDRCRAIEKEAANGSD